MTASAQALVVVQPITITDAILNSSTVAEADYTAWNAATAYTALDRVIRTSTHKIYERIISGTTATAPESDAVNWAEVSPTNRWKAFDTSNGTQTAQTTSIVYELEPGQAISAFAALNLTGATSVRLEIDDPTYGAVYDTTWDVTGGPPQSDWWSWFFATRQAIPDVVATDLPTYPAAVYTITLAGGADLAVGVLMLGQASPLGLGVNLGAGVGIQDYSRKETNDYGDAVLIQRAYAKRANFDMTLERMDVDATVQLLASLRATPCLWIGSSQYSSTIIFGFFKDFSITISYPMHSDCSLSIEGLT